MNILHLEASEGWGGQEIRILVESKGMRERGHNIFFAVSKKGKIKQKLMDNDFSSFNLNFKRRFWGFSFFKLIKLIWQNDIDIINTHSSKDAWLGGIVGRVLNIPIIRTRHLSTNIKKGANLKILYKILANYIVTTCENTKLELIKYLGKYRCQSIPTGVKKIKVSSEEINDFKISINLKKNDFVIGTACILRSWKGIEDMLQAAFLLKNIENIKFVIIGDGNLNKYKRLAERLNIQNKVVFTGFLTNPFPAMASLDIFLLLSTKHEGVSQATLQAAMLKKPLITTSIGGLWEVCIDNLTGLQVPVNQPKKIAEAIKKLQKDPSLRKKMGEEAYKLVYKYFNYDDMIVSMENIYKKLVKGN